MQTPPTSSQLTDSGQMVEDSPQPSEGVDGLLYEAWGVIANAQGWNEDSEWRQAAERWRDRWHAYLDWALKANA